MVPKEFLEQLVIEQPVANLEPPAVDESDPVGDEPAVADTRSFSGRLPTDVVDAPAVVTELTAVAPTVSPVLRLIADVVAASRFGDDREKIVKAWSDREWDIVVEVDRVSTPFGSNAMEPHPNGRTTTGVVKATEQAIEVSTPEGRFLDGLSRSDQWPVRVVVSEWDLLYNRIVSLEIPSA